MSQTIIQESAAQKESAMQQESAAQKESAMQQESAAQQESAMQPKTKVVVPPMRYQLSKLSRFEALTQISSLTHNFCDLPSGLVNWIHWDISSRQFTSFGYIPAPPNVDMVKQIIGIDGYYLKLTTTNCGVDFIWHNRTTNEFHFWGEYSRCIHAMNQIRYRICKVVESYKNKPTEHVFQNDINPHPAVCYEAIIEVDKNGEYVRKIASKHYPDQPVSS
jgi:hypothetical protein